MSTDSGVPRRTHGGSRRHAIRPTWCCSFSLDPQTPQSKPYSPVSKPPSLTSRRILSPGRVSPIDSDTIDSDPIQEKRLSSVEELRDGGSFRGFRIRIKGREGELVVLNEKDKEMICRNSEVFRDLNSNLNLSRGFEIELEGLDGFEGFKDTIGLIYQKGESEMRWLQKLGATRAINILEISLSITYQQGVTSCLKYLEMVPWTENEEEKLKTLMKTLSQDKTLIHGQTLIHDIESRINPNNATSSPDLTVQLIKSITNGSNSKARKDLHSLINGILSNSSIYNKDILGLNKEGIYEICHSILNSLVDSFKEEHPKFETVSNLIENLTWVCEILLEKQIGEEFVDIWINQNELINLHELSSPMVRYELGRISAIIFISLGKGKLHINLEKRFGLFKSWFMPLLVDFGWLKRCPKGLNLRLLEDNLGNSLLTLSLSQQKGFFLEWFRVFSEKGRECPNLSRSFQVWWRRSFVRSTA